MSELIVRRAEKKDIDGILSLLVQVNLVHHLGRPDLFKKTVKYGPEDLEQMILDDDAPIFVCVPAEEAEGEEHRVLGHAFCISQTPPNAVFQDIRTLYIDDICVDENARRLGVGRKLYEYVENYAREKDFYNLTLNVWALNTGAKAFYDSCGMQIQKYGMEKILK